MIYFLGGPPRVGKSKISNLITKKCGISSVSTDSLGVVLENVLDPRTARKLFAVSELNEMPLANRIELMVEETSRRIDPQFEEGRATWRAVAPFIRKKQRKAVMSWLKELPCSRSLWLNSKSLITEQSS